jgi:hypothetical protein
LDSVSKAMIGLFDEEVAIFPSKTTSRLFLYLDSTDVMVREDGYCLFDFNLIISSCMGCQSDKTGPCIFQKGLNFEATTYRKIAEIF